MSLADEPGRICTVSTVKDSLPNLAEFVQRNLAAGADHMLVFVDDADPDIHAGLDAMAHVTSVRTGRRYWGGRRPPSLNSRQVVNANVANVVLASVPSVRWLVHLDADECLHLDKERLLALDESVDTLRLGTWEAVSRERGDGPVTDFKRPLDPDELSLLTLLGVVDRPRMRRYFRGNTHKPGLRPDPGRRLLIHSVQDLAGKPVEPFRADWLHVLHHESPSFEAFLRKWSALLSSGGVKQRASRTELRAALSAVARNPALDEERRREVLREVYTRAVEDDAETLDRLGYLERPDPAWHNLAPVPLTDEDRGTLEALLAIARDTDKRYFGTYRDALDPTDLFRDVVPRSDRPAAG